MVNDGEVPANYTVLLFTRILSKTVSFWLWSDPNRL